MQGSPPALVLQRQVDLAVMLQHAVRLRRVLDLEGLQELGRRAARLSGYTDVEFTIDREGRVIGAGILSSTSTAFEGPSLEAIQGWRFEPVVVGGRAVPAQSVMRFSFVN